MKRLPLFLVRTVRTYFINLAFGVFPYDLPVHVGKKIQRIENSTSKMAPQINVAHGGFVHGKQRVNQIELNVDDQGWKIERFLMLFPMFFLLQNIYLKIMVFTIWTYFGFESGKSYSESLEKDRKERLEKPKELFPFCKSTAQYIL